MFDLSAIERAFRLIPRQSAAVKNQTRKIHRKREQNKLRFTVDSNEPRTVRKPGPRPMPCIAVCRI